MMRGATKNLSLFNSPMEKVPSREGVGAKKLQVGTTTKLMAATVSSV